MYVTYDDPFYGKSLVKPTMV